jgi:hypothetical protein
LIPNPPEKAWSRGRAAELGRKWTILRLALSSGMQKHLLHHLILLLTLIFGSGAAAWAAHTTAIIVPSAEAPMTESLHLFDHKSFEQVGDVYVKVHFIYGNGGHRPTRLLYEVNGHITPFGN